MIRVKRLTNILLLLNLLFPLIIFFLYYLNLITPSAFASWIIGWLLIFTGFLLELWFIKRGIHSDNKSFIRNILGAVTARLLCTLILIFIALRLLELNQNNFIFSIFIFYIFYLICEILYLNSGNN